MFSHDKAGIPTNHKLKRIEEEIEKQKNTLKTSRKILPLFIVPFLVRIARQQLKIKLPHFTVFHHPHHFAWVKSQATPLKILNIILIHLQ